MSNIYIQEPPTFGKVLLTTSVGDIDIELWSKETPKACRNFVQLLMEGYYNDTIFHRIVKDFIVQGGDPTGTGTGGESIYGAPFKDEIHSRLRFARRGLVAMANAGPNDNGSQFFFTFGPAPELNKKHTIFGKVVGNTLFNMLKLQDVETDDNERPLFPPKIVKTEILSNPFDDIVPRVIKKKKDAEDVKKPKSQSKATKNFNLLSFGEEAEEDEEETDKATVVMRGKSKSSHDLIDDPRLSSVPALDTEERAESKKRKSGGETESSDPGSDKEKTVENVRKKLRRDEPDHSRDAGRKDVVNEKEDKKREDNKRDERRKDDVKKEESKKEEAIDDRRGDSKRDDRKKDEIKIDERKKEEIKKEERKRDDKGNEKRKDNTKEDKKKDEGKESRKKEDHKHEENKDRKKEKGDREKDEKREERSREGQKQMADSSKMSKSDEMRKESRKLQRELAEAKKKKDGRGEDRRETKNEDKHDSQPSGRSGKTHEEDVKRVEEDETMPKVDMLEEYKQERQKYKELRSKQGKKGSNREAETLAMLAKFQKKLQNVKTIAVDYEDDEENMEENEDDNADVSWMRHRLQFEDKSRKVLDANVTDSDRYTIIDPRNPITKRRREAGKEKKSSRHNR